MIRLTKLVIFFLLFSGICAAEESGKKPAFLRISKDTAGKYISFDTLIASYQKQGSTVDLVSVVHIGEKEYYEKLNERFKNYDAVLFELIADPGADLSQRSSAGEESTITAVQTGFKSLLGLEFQLDVIDYVKPNFFHADMSPGDFVRSMQTRNESVWSILFKLFINSHELSKNRANLSPEIFLLQMLLSPNKKLAFRKIMAAQFQDVDGFLEVVDGPEGSTLISERNKVAIQVLEKKLAEGKKTIAIFYGAGHMPDMEQRIFKLGFTKAGEEWIVAWNLR